MFEPEIFFFKNKFFGRTEFMGKPIYILSDDNTMNTSLPQLLKTMNILLPLINKFDVDDISIILDENNISKVSLIVKGKPYNLTVNTSCSMIETNDTNLVKVLDPRQSNYIRLCEKFKIVNDNIIESDFGLYLTGKIDGDKLNSILKGVDYNRLSYITRVFINILRMFNNIEYVVFEKYKMSFSTGDKFFIIDIDKMNHILNELNKQLLKNKTITIVKSINNLTEIHTMDDNVLITDGEFTRFITSNIDDLNKELLDDIVSDKYVDFYELIFHRDSFLSLRYGKRVKILNYETIIFNPYISRLKKYVKNLKKLNNMLREFSKYGNIIVYDISNVQGIIDKNDVIFSFSDFNMMLPTITFTYDFKNDIVYIVSSEYDVLSSSSLSGVFNIEKIIRKYKSTLEFQK